MYTHLVPSHVPSHGTTTAGFAPGQCLSWTTSQRPLLTRMHRTVRLWYPAPQRAEHFPGFCMCHLAGRKRIEGLRWENKESIYVTISTEDYVTYLRRQLMLQSSVTLLGRVFWSQREFDTSWPSIARTHLGRRFLCPEIGRQKWLKGSSKKWCDC